MAELNKNERLDEPVNADTQVLIYMLDRYRTTQSEKDRASVLSCLEKVSLRVPFVPSGQPENVPGKENEKRVQLGLAMLSSKADGKKFIAAYSSVDSLPEAMRKNVVMARLPYAQVLKMAAEGTNCDGIVIDPYTANMRIEKEETVKLAEEHSQKKAQEETAEQ